MSSSGPFGSFSSSYCQSHRSGPHSSRFSLEIQLSPRHRSESLRSFASSSGRAERLVRRVPMPPSPTRLPQLCLVPRLLSLAVHTFLVALAQADLAAACQVCFLLYELNDHTLLRLVLHDLSMDSSASEFSPLFTPILRGEVSNRLFGLVFLCRP